MISSTILYYWSIPKKTFTQITFSQIHIFGPRFMFWREKCVNLHKLCVIFKNLGRREATSTMDRNYTNLSCTNHKIT